MVRDRLIDSQIRHSRNPVNESGLDLPQHLMGSPPFACEIEPLKSPPRGLYKVKGEGLIVCDPVSEHERTTEENYLIGMSLRFRRYYPQAIPINSIGHICDESPIE